jgi:transcription-repair coupling factor (superfamily II helicase)
MSVVQWVQTWQNAEASKFIESHLQTPEEAAIIHLKGLIGSSYVWQIVASYALNPLKTFLVIMPSKEEALYAVSDIESIIQKIPTDIKAGQFHYFFFPDSFSKTGHFNSEEDTTQIMQRTEVLTHFLKSSAEGRLVVTYPEALMEKVTSQKNLQKHILHFKKGEMLNLDFMIELLVELNFERNDFVYEPGQFSIRGGIVDIFSFGNDMPYRVELFGNEVESIRTFEPISQLSVRQINHVTIIPNTNQINEGSTTGSFFDFAPINSVIWLKDGKQLDQLLEGYKEKLEQVNDAIIDTHYYSNLFKNIGQRKVIEWGTQFYFPVISSWQYNQLPQPYFNKNFDLLISNLKELQTNKFQNLICSDNVKQTERITNIIDDLTASKGKNLSINKALQITSLGIALHQGFIDNDLKIACYTDHQIFERFHQYKKKAGFTKSNAINIKALKELTPGDYVVHIDHGVGKYSGLQKLEMNGIIQEVVRIFYKDNDVLYVNINSLHKLTKYSGKEGIEPKINKLGSEAWEQLKRKTKTKIKEIAFDLIQLYAKRKAAIGFQFSPDTYLQNELEASFIYEDTPDQYKATQDVKLDMEKPHPMDRLVCGDVGFGKTEVAIRAAFKAVTDSKQVAVLVPTTILAMQHAKTFEERLKEFPCKIEFINRFKTAKELKIILENVALGKVDIIIGTHMLLGNKIKFKDLGLMIIDEEQKFGVAAKDKLKLIKTTVDTLTLTATPIPRTLQFSMMGARDLSIINTAPPNRQPVQTTVNVFDPQLIKEAIEYEVYRGGQVYFIHNKVNDIGEVAALIRKLCPDFEIGVAHGQLEGEQLEERMLAFINRTYDILVCTNIVESGLDISNANTIIINHAHHHGLSDLHQLRGRVGRNNKKAFCYLLAPPKHILTPEARRRLQTIEQFSDLGSGFNISLRDLDIRGAGNLLGGEQSGFIAEIGFEMYHKILDEAIKELKETDFKDLFENTNTDTIPSAFVTECAIDTDTEMLIPDDYINNINERLIIYRQLDDITNEPDLQKFSLSLLDRFGPMPEPVLQLLDGIRLRWVATMLGFERLQLKNGMLRCFFIAEQQSKFYETSLFQSLLVFINSQGQRCILKQTDKHLILTVKHIINLKKAKEFLEMAAELKEVN